MNAEELHTLIEKEQPNICQIVGWKDGREIFSDEWNGYQKSDACHVMSVTKSIVSLLVGIAIDKGLITSVHQRVLDFFPEYTVKRGEKTIQEVTIEHLLTMTAPYKYRYEPWSKVCSSDDWTKAALDLLGGRKGLSREFRYSTLGIHILTGILAKTSGMDSVDFANAYLFEPLGIPAHANYLAATAEEHKRFVVSREPKENIWFCDPQGVGAAGFGLCFSAEDMGRIGQLCLDEGTFEGRRVVSPEWVREMAAARCSCGDEFRGMQYGYLWWIVDEKEGSYAAIGNSGNVIYVNPGCREVIAVTSYFKPTIFDRVDFLREVVEPFVMGE